MNIFLKSISCLLIFLSLTGCNDDYPHISNDKYSGSDFVIKGIKGGELLGSLGLDRSKFWVEGTFNGNRLKTNVDAIYGCPFFMEIKAKDNVVKYSIKESDMQEMAKSASDKCANDYTALLIDKVHLLNENKYTYQN